MSDDGSDAPSEEEGVMVNGILLPNRIAPFRQGSEEVVETARRVCLYEEGEQCFGIVVGAEELEVAQRIMEEHKLILARMVWEAVNRADEEHALKDLQRAINPGQATIDIEDDYERTPLHHAVSHNYVEVATLVLEHDVDVDAPDEANKTALYDACACGHEAVARFLIEEYDAELNEKAELGWTALHAACAMGKLATAKLLLQQDKTEIETTDESGHTPLHDAVDNGDEDMTQLLLRYKANVNAADVYGATPLHVACAQGHADLAALLVKYHADTRRTDRFGCTPLHAAVRGGHAEVVEVLLEHNPPLEAQDTVGRNVLHVATLEAQSDAFDALLGTENEAVDWRAAMRQRMRDGRTPLDVCGGGERDGLEAMGTAMRQYIADRAESESEAAEEDAEGGGSDNGDGGGGGDDEAKQSEPAAEAGAG